MLIDRSIDQVIADSMRDDPKPSNRMSYGNVHLFLPDDDDNHDLGDPPLISLA